MTREDILTNPLCKRCFDIASSLLLVRNNKVSESTLIKVAEILFTLETKIKGKEEHIAELKECCELYKENIKSLKEAHDEIVKAKDEEIIELHKMYTKHIKEALDATTKARKYANQVNEEIEMLKEVVKTYSNGIEGILKDKQC